MRIDKLTTLIHSLAMEGLHSNALLFLLPISLLVIYLSVQGEETSEPAPTQPLLVEVRQPSTNSMAGSEPPSIKVRFDPHAPVDGVLDFDLDAPHAPFASCMNNQGQMITCPPLPDLEPDPHPDSEPESGDGE